MSFVSLTYALFLPTVFLLYWLISDRRLQNAMLLVASYLFYGWIHPWFCMLIAISTTADYFFAIGMEGIPQRRRLFLIGSLAFNLGFLGFFKYFGFFAENVQTAASAIGLHLDPFTLRIYLPVGISFYTFQSLSYIIDVYRGDLKARKNFIDFALFVSFFPQLVAGPIERATHLLPQVESPRRWNTRLILEAVPLIIVGVLKKLVIADNVAVLVNRIFMLEHPTFLILLLGAIAFAIQIYYDFSGYTDIARGSAWMLGFNLMENFRRPYAAISPSDFWRRWHISFSSWIRDYLYIPLGGSRVSSRWKFALVVMTTMTISGLWHGAAWNFVLWGALHGAILLAYHLAGRGGRWEPRSHAGWILAWILMQFFVLTGWLLFRMPSLSWLIEATRHMTFAGGKTEALAALATLVTLLFYAIPCAMVTGIAFATSRNSPAIRAVLLGVSLLFIILFARGSGNDFIYFRF